MTTAEGMIAIDSLRCRLLMTVSNAALMAWFLLNDTVV